MADQMNGTLHSPFGIPLPPDETVPFTIGKETVQVPVLNLWVMQQCKTQLLELGPGLDFITYAAHVIKIVHTSLRNSNPNLTVSEQEMLKLCSLKEMRALPERMNELLRASGLDDDPGPLASPEVSPADGTGTSQPLLPNLLPQESAAETSDGFSNRIP